MKPINNIRLKNIFWHLESFSILASSLMLAACGQSQSQALLQGGGITVTNPTESTKSLPNEMPKGLDFSTFTSPFGYAFRFDSNLKRISVTEAGAEFNARKSDSESGSRIMISAIDPQLGLKSEMDLKKRVALTATKEKFDVGQVVEVKNEEGQIHFEFLSKLVDGAVDQWLWMLAPNRLLLEIHLVLASKDVGTVIEDSFRATIDSLTFDLTPPRLVEAFVNSKPQALILKALGIEEGAEPEVFLYFSNRVAGAKNLKWKGRAERLKDDQFGVRLANLPFNSQSSYKLEAVGIRDLAGNWTHLILRGDDKTYVSADLPSGKDFNELEPGDWRSTPIKAISVEIP